MCMTCAGQAPAAAASVSGLLAYGSVAGAAALGVLGLRRGRGAPSREGLEALAEIIDRPGAATSDDAPSSGERADR
jgi:hypothetical protein